MKNKFKVNQDHFPTKEIKLAYAKGRISSDAAVYIAERFKEDATKPYKTISDLFEHMQTIYIDLNRLFTTKNEFKKLYIKKD
jgi:hypothetical protein